MWLPRGRARPTGVPPRRGVTRWWRAGQAQVHWWSCVARGWCPETALLHLKADLNANEPGVTAPGEKGIWCRKAVGLRARIREHLRMELSVLVCSPLEGSSTHMSLLLTSNIAQSSNKKNNKEVHFHRGCGLSPDVVLLYTLGHKVKSSHLHSEQHLVVGVITCVLEVLNSHDATK